MVKLRSRCLVEAVKQAEGDRSSVDEEVHRGHLVVISRTVAAALVAAVGGENQQGAVKFIVHVCIFLAQLAEVFPLLLR